MRHLTFFYLIFSFVFLAPATTLADNSAGSYQAERDKMLKARGNGSDPFSAEDKRIMKQAADNLAANFKNPGLPAGTKAPVFSLRNAFGKIIRLNAELKKGPVVLVFYRGAWCPFCNLHLHALQKHVSTFERYRARLIAITPQKPDKSVIQIKKDEFNFEVLSDLDSSVMRSYNLLYQLDDELVKVYKKHGLDVEDFNGIGRNVLPVPGTFVIDTKGKIRAAHADVDYKQRMEPEAIIQILKKL